MKNEKPEESLSNLMNSANPSEENTPQNLDSVLSDLSKEIGEQEAKAAAKKAEAPAVEEATAKKQDVDFEHAIGPDFKMPDKMHQNVPVNLTENEKSAFGSVIAQAKKRAEDSRKNTIDSNLTPGGEEAEDNTSANQQFKDTYLEPGDIETPETEENKKEPAKKSNIIKIDGVEMDLTQITKVRVTKDGKNYEKNRHKRLEARKSYQIVAPISGYSANMLSISSSEIINLSSLSVDEYRRIKAHFTKLYEKMVDPSVPMTFDEFLKCTAMFEQNTFWFGIFSNTYPGENEFTATCNGNLPDGKPCDHEYKFYMKNSDFIDIPDGVTQQAIVEVVQNALNAKDLLNRSRVNTLDRVFCPNAQIVVDIRVPSMYNFLEDTLANMRKINQLMIDDVIVNLMPFIESVNVYDGDGVFIEVTDFDKKYKELYDLSDDDLKIVVTSIEDLVQSLPQLNYSFKIPPCPKCGTRPKEDDVKIPHVSTLVFLIHQQKAALESNRT